MEKGRRTWIGIDPGPKSGAIAILYPDRVLRVNKCPLTVKDMMMLLPDSFQNHVFAVLEKVHSFPKQGVVSTFKFGQNYGEWRALLTALRIPWIEVTSIKWQRHFGSMPKADPKPKKIDFNTEDEYKRAIENHKRELQKAKRDRKNHILHLAQQRFPNTHITQQMADAVLICLYGKESQ